MGFYQPTEDLTRFVSNAQSEFKIPIRYLQEYKSLGTGGGIYHFRDVIRTGNPQAVFMINGDIVKYLFLKISILFDLNS